MRRILLTVIFAGLAGCSDETKIRMEGPEGVCVVTSFHDGTKFSPECHTFSTSTATGVYGAAGVRYERGS